MTKIVSFLLLSTEKLQYNQLNAELFLVQKSPVSRILHVSNYLAVNKTKVFSNDEFVSQ